MEKIACDQCDKKFDQRAALDQHKAAVHSGEKSEPEWSTPKKKNHFKLIAIGSISILIIVAIIWAVSSVSVWPPIDMRGHIEVNPPAHILKEPMSLDIQKHMLEHADGVEEGPPGIIINYNCIDYACEPNLIENLEAFAIKYPETVYVAPFNRMKAIIVLTKLGRREILQEYNEDIIEAFI